MAISSTTIAKICGVSQGTVDRALHNRKEINAETKERILKVAQEYGYRPNLLARGLKEGETKTIGIIVFDLAHSFFTQLVTELILNLKKHDIISYVTITNKDPQAERECLIHLADLRVDGIILCPIQKDTTFIKLLDTLSVPIVTVGNSLLCDKYPFVGIYERDAVIDSVKYIQSHGYQNIVYVSPPVVTDTSTNDYGLSERIKGFYCAMDLCFNNKNPLVIRGDSYIQEIISQIPVFTKAKKTALLCHNDHYAIILLKKLQEYGLRIPNDIGIMGFDNIITLGLIDPRLTTVDYRISAIGESAVSTLLKLKAKKKKNEAFEIVESLFIDHSIIIGETI